MSSMMNPRNILQLMRDREVNDQIRSRYALKNKMNSKCISKLGLLAELEGHQGCVNCLQWNANGSMLGSASDDFQVILWDPFMQKIKTTIKTLHRGNIFTVKFIPSSNDDIVATGAGDWSSHTYDVTTGRQLSACTCAQGRIKRIAVANDMPSVYWSASEDGSIRQHDMRMTHMCNSEQSKNVLVSVYTYLGTIAEVKCLDINQFRTEQLAVGANDPYVRLYDRRMIRSLSSFVTKNHPLPKDPLKLALLLNNERATFKRTDPSDNFVQYFIPGHIHIEGPGAIKKHQNIGTTYLTFSPDGRELLVNLGGEHIYLYDLLNQKDSTYCAVPKVVKIPRENGEGSSTDLLDEPFPVEYTTLPADVEKLKLEANYLFEQQDYTTAIKLYNRAIQIFESGILFSNRAAAYIKRKWEGDLYAALRDCVTALQLDSNHMKAYFRMIVCLFELGKINDSKMYLEQFKMKFPSYKNSPAYKNLYSDIKIAYDAKKNDADNTEEHIRDVGQLINQNEDISEDVKFGQSQRRILEEYFRNKSKDYHHRYFGHCNTSTDIKEANFFGNQGQFIVGGSDDGFFFVWDKSTENNVIILKGDSSIVNCLQPHPSEFMLATSGIDNEVKLWAPLPDEFDNNLEVKDFRATAMLNQRRMMTDPFEVILRNMSMSMEDQIAMDRASEHYVVGSIPEQFYTCRPS